jgi:hypothetical protein
MCYLQKYLVDVGGISEYSDSELKENRFALKTLSASTSDAHPNGAACPPSDQLIISQALNANWSKPHISCLPVISGAVTRGYSVLQILKLARLRCAWLCLKASLILFICGRFHAVHPRAFSMPQWYLNKVSLPFALKYFLSSKVSIAPAISSPSQRNRLADPCQRSGANHYLVSI